MLTVPRRVTHADSFDRSQRRKVVQLVQGEKLAIESSDLDGWIERFSKFPQVQLIDLDAAMGIGTNDALVRQIRHALPCRVGGGDPIGGPCGGSAGGRREGGDRRIGVLRRPASAADGGSVIKLDFAEALARCGRHRQDHRRGRRQGRPGGHSRMEDDAADHARSRRCKALDPYAVSSSTRTSTRKD